jgi:hypothetical protein
VRSKLSPLPSERVRLLVLLAVLAGLGVYAARSWSGFGGGSPVATECPQDEAPVVQTVGREQVRALRAGVRGVVYFAPGIEPYEEGPAAASYAWSDGEPGSHGSVPAAPRQPGGWEVRWWMPTRDDVVADAFIFAGEGEARDFLRRATSARCRTAARSVSAPYPPGGRNLGWRNPEGLAQEDLYLRRGRRVYRISVVRPGADGRASRAERHLGFEIANALGCGLPGAGCPPLAESSPAAPA